MHLSSDAWTLGALLRWHRANAGLTQEQLAERAGLSRRGIADLERGARRAPHRNTIERLAHALDLSAQEQAKLIGAANRVRSSISAVRRGRSAAALRRRRTNEPDYLDAQQAFVAGHRQLRTPGRGMRNPCESTRAFL